MDKATSYMVEVTSQFLGDSSDGSHMFKTVKRVIENQKIENQ